MKRAFAFVSVSALLLGVAGTAGAKPAPPASKPRPRPSAPKLSKWQQHVQETLRNAAPGDEYFGRLKMSYLGINNTFRDESIRAGAYTTDPRIITRVSFAEEALNDWAHRYPRDPQLARSYFLGFQMDRKIWTQDYQQRAFTYANLVVSRFPSSYFAKALRASLKIGFTEHYFATPVPCGLVEASPLPTPANGNRRGATPAPSPTPTETPTPTPSPAPGQPKVEILPVPCLTPTPSPSPTPTPTPTPSPTPRGMTPPPASPSPSGSPSPGITPSPAATTSASPSATPTSHPTHKPYEPGKG